MISTIVTINGYYDILCALAILKIVRIPTLNTLHLSMFKHYHIEDVLFQRFIAYWIFLNGTIRIYGPYSNGSNSLNGLYGSNGPSLVVFSYYFEALVFLNELIRGSVFLNKAAFVIVTSLFLGYQYNASQSMYQVDSSY
jgi:hypothetical protein